MTNIVVLIKQVPDTWSERKLSDGDYTLDRDAADAVLDEINERAVEEALLLKEKDGGEVKVLSAGPDRATEAIRKALSMGCDSAVHLNDPALHGSDAIQTAWALAAALGQVEFENGEPADLVIAGNEATDGRIGAVPAIIAEYLGIPQLTQMRKLVLADGKISGERETDEGVFGLEADLPAIVSVTEKINEPRFPSFKGIMAAKKKAVQTLTLADIGVEPETVGVANAGTTVTSSTPKPPKTAGERVTDEGEGGDKIAEYLVGQKII
jgi:electron transfer flavoprotein beta subunit